MFIPNSLTIPSPILPLATVSSGYTLFWLSFLPPFPHIQTPF